jgi:mycothione reductase
MFTELYSKKYKAYLGYEIKSVSNVKVDSGSQFHIAATRRGGNASEKTLDIVSDQLLIAAGRVPNSDTLDLDKTGVKMSDRDYVVTGRYLETNAKGYLQLDVVGCYLQTQCK